LRLRKSSHITGPLDSIAMKRQKLLGLEEPFWFKIGG